MVAPYFMNRIPYAIRIIFSVHSVRSHSPPHSPSIQHNKVTMAVGAFILTAFAPEVWLKLIGVGMGSIGSGFGELTFLAYSAYYHKNTISAWSSGERFSLHSCQV